jgi:hypothetical protein
MKKRKKVGDDHPAEPSLPPKYLFEVSDRIELQRHLSHRFES